MLADGWPCGPVIPANAGMTHKGTEFGRPPESSETPGTLRHTEVFALLAGGTSRLTDSSSGKTGKRCIRERQPVL